MTPLIRDPDLTLYVGDCLDVLRTLPDGCVDCCVTSPPYWGLRDYGTGSWDGGDPDCDHTAVRREHGDHEKQATSAGTSRDRIVGEDCRRCGATRVDRQLGLEASPAEYVAAMVAVFGEVRRVLADHGTLWLNLGDSYTSGPRGNAPDDWSSSGLTGVQTSARYRETLSNGTAQTRDKTKIAGLKPKDLVGIPWRVAFALQADGWYLRSDIIWAKPNPMPESVTDRPTKAHEFVFMFSKAPWRGREPGPIESRLTTDDARWLALLVDAEGNICVKRNEREGRSPSYGAQVAVGSTSRALLERARDLVGAGAVLERAGTNAPMFYWQVAGKQAQDFLYAIYPHLIVKPRQARIVIHMESLLYHRGTQNGKRRTDAENVELESLWIRNKACNQFGDPDLSDVPAPKYGKWGPSRYFFDQEAVREPHSPDGRLKTVHDHATLASHPNYDNVGNGNERWPNGGRNVRSVWQIATQPYADAHFATFPEELPRRCILAGCPEWVCGTCGKARERIVETTGQTLRQIAAELGHSDYSQAYGENPQGINHSGGHGSNEQRVRRDVGWSDCGHNDYRPGTVLDPFFGSGTTGLVARKHGRRTIGIELNEDYAQMAARRLQQLSLLA